MTLMIYNDAFYRPTVPGAPSHLQHIAYYRPDDVIKDLVQRVYSLAENKLTHSLLGLTINDLFSVDLATLSDLEAQISEITARLDKTTADLNKDLGIP